jgi:hypothetical protein
LIGALLEKRSNRMQMGLIERDGHLTKLKRGGEMVAISRAIGKARAASAIVERALKRRGL